MALQTQPSSANERSAAVSEDQPQRLSVDEVAEEIWRDSVLGHCCGWSSTQPRSSAGVELRPRLPIARCLSRPFMPLTPTVRLTMQHSPIMIPQGVSRRAFLRASAALAGGAPLLAGLLKAQSAEAKAPLMAYVGTFSSPLRDVLPTQVDLPPGNGRGIHLFQVNRTTGVMIPNGVHELATSPSCLALNAAGTRLYSGNETDRVGDGKEGTVSAFAINRADGQLKLLNTVRSGGAGPTYVSVHPSGRFLLVANYFGGSVAVLPILPDGGLGAATDVKNDAGKLGPTRATNAPSGSFAFSGHDRTHAHMIQADPRVASSCMPIWAWIKSLSGSSMSRSACSLRMIPPRSRCRRETGRGISTSTRMDVGSIPFRKKPRTSSCSITTPRRDGSQRGRRSPVCRLDSPAAISAPRSWFPPMAGSFMRATACTTALGSSPWAKTAG